MIRPMKRPSKPVGRESCFAINLGGIVTASDTKLLADPADGHAVRTIASHSVEALDRLQQRLAAELKCLVMYGDEALGAGVVSHLPGLLRSAMVMNPGIVRADGHDGEIDGPGGPHGPKRRRH